MIIEGMNDIFTEDIFKDLFPKDRTDQFFDALLGDATEGAYDISLVFKGHDKDRLLFEFHLNQRPGKCLACNLTYGLPKVFSRHPIININGIVQEIDQRLNGRAKCVSWELGNTREVSHKLHVIPFTVFLDNN